MNRSRQARSVSTYEGAMSVTLRTSSRVRLVARSSTASDGHRPPGKMYVWIQFAPRNCCS